MLCTIATLTWQTLNTILIGVQMHSNAIKFPTRDTRHVKEIDTLKAENRSLKKQITHLRKELHRLEHTVERNIEEAPAMAKATRAAVPKCKMCDSTDLKTLTIPSGVFSICMACGQKMTSKT